MAILQKFTFLFFFLLSIWFIIIIIFSLIGILGLMTIMSDVSCNIHRHMEGYRPYHKQFLFRPRIVRLNIQLLYLYIFSISQYYNVYRCCDSVYSSGRRPWEWNQVFTADYISGAVRMVALCLGSFPRVARVIRKILSYCGASAGAAAVWSKTQERGAGNHAFV